MRSCGQVAAEQSEAITGAATAIRERRHADPEAFDRTRGVMMLRLESRLAVDRVNIEEVRKRGLRTLAPLGYGRR
jgi:hypothetical protein